MKLVLATPLYPPESGGPATDAALLNEALPRHGIETVVCSFSQFRRFPRGVRHFRYGYALLRAALHTDGIMALDTFSVCVPAAAVAFLLHKQLIVRVPGDFAWEQAVQRFGVTDSLDEFQKKRYGMSVEWLRALQTSAVRSAALVIVPSDYLRGIVEQWGVTPSRLLRIYLGIKLDEKPAMPVEIPPGKILFSLGRFVPWKGFSMLVELIAELPSEWHLVLAGDGPLRPKFAREARRLGIEDRVWLIGYVPHAEALGWYHQADAFALNTSFESFSFQILEAMANRAAIITTTAGSIPELITDGTEGVLCAPGDKDAFKEAILSIESEPESWKVRKENAEQRAKEFTAEASIEAFATAVTNVCG